MNTTQTEIKNDGILRGYTSKEKSFEVKNYPWGFRLKTSIFYWIETKEGKGDRLGTYTIDPKTGRACKPKYSTYNAFMYLYIDPETGHVKHGSIDSYDREEFEGRFYFIIGKIGEEFISEEQKKNIRVNHYQHVYGNAPYELAKYSEEMKPVFKEWLTNTLKHIKTCAFSELVNYPEKPAFDNPNGEVKMIVTEYTTQ